MLAFIADRLLRLALVVVGAVMIAFVLLRLSGDPASVLLPIFASPAQRAEFRQHFGLDHSLPVQFVDYSWRVLQGDMGQSWQYRQSAAHIVLDRFPNTLELAAVSMALALLVGILLGVAAAVRSGGFLDSATISLALVARAIPSFWLGTLLILFFSLKLHWLPTSGIGGLPHLVMPAVSIALVFVGEVAMVVRASMVEALVADYVRAALAKGLPTRIIVFRHALRNSLNPLISVVAVNFGILLGGTVIVENVFAWPGIGTLAIASVGSRDYPVLQATVLILAISVALVTTAADLLYGLVDPRIRRVG
jgi:peptide/nickel transport system permease protein